jgi:hypothetical protein
MQQYHYLGSLPKISNTIWYGAFYGDTWLALLSFSASALKCHARDHWIGWDQRLQYHRLHLIANNSRFLILPHCHHKNLATRILGLCRRRIQADWQHRFGFPLLMLETFVDPPRFKGTIYRAANWKLVGKTKGYRRIRNSYSSKSEVPKLVFLYPLQTNAKRILSGPFLPQLYLTGEPRMKLSADHMRSLPDFFKNIPDPRRAAGKRHSIHVVLSIATAAVLCGMRGYKAIHDWATSQSPRVLDRFGYCFSRGKHGVPSESTFRNVLIRVNPVELDKAFQQWNGVYGVTDDSLCIDGKIMRNAIDENGRQTHVMSAIGHQSKQCYTQKKSVLCR